MTRRIVVTENVSLDGVMQAPALPDEDPRDGFTRGGWAGPYVDHVAGEFMAGGGTDGELLLGRRTYENMAAHWPGMPADNPFTAWINGMGKWVASTTLTAPLDWNARLLVGDLGPALCELKASDGPDLTVLGSGVLVAALRELDLVDEWLLSIHPLLLGHGRRLFADGPPTELKTLDTVTTSTGVIITRMA